MKAEKPGLADLKRLRKQSAAADEAARIAPAAEPLRTKDKGPADKGPAGLAGMTLLTEPASMHAAGVETAGKATTEPDLDAKDRALFRRAVKSAQPIKDTRRAVLPRMATQTARMLIQRRLSATGQAVPIALAPVSDHYTPAALQHMESNFVQKGCGPDLIRKLKRGIWPVQATLDLHGATLDEARERLEQFLQSCLTHGIKCVRIIHGKGYGSKDGTPVLKQTVRRWLTQFGSVLAYSECQEQDGGTGAVQVLLRR